MLCFSTGKGATLISPDTPRPKKSYALQYQNGTAYTFVLGMRCNTNVYYTTISQAQPTYVQNKPKLSMYSNWKIVQKDTHPSRLPPEVTLSTYNSVHHESKYGIFTNSTKLSLNLTHSSQWKLAKGKQKPEVPFESEESQEDSANSAETKLRKVEGGYKSSEDVKTYVRGRGRGR